MQSVTEDTISVARSPTVGIKKHNTVFTKRRTQKMKCPVCNGETKVICSRATDNSVIRWRKCIDCKQSIYTEELETTHNAFKNAQNNYVTELRKLKEGRE